MRGFQKECAVEHDSVVLELARWTIDKNRLIAQLEKIGLDAHKLPEYGILTITGASYQEIHGVISHDLMSVNPDIFREDPMAFQRTVNQCTDAAIDAAKDISQQLYFCYDGQDLSQVRLERWLGNSLVITRPRTNHATDISDCAVAP